MQIHINGTDRSSAIDWKSFDLTPVVTDRSTTLNFTLLDRSGTILPMCAQEVLVYNDSNALIFGGEISQKTVYSTAPGSSEKLYDIECIDFSKRLNATLVTKDYAGQHLADIVADLLTNYAPAFTHTNTETGPVVSSISFDHKGVHECLQDLAATTGYNYFVDYNKDINFFAVNAQSAPYSLTEDIGTSGHYGDLKIAEDMSQLANSITFINPNRPSIQTDGKTKAPWSGADFWNDANQTLQLTYAIDTSQSLIPGTLAVPPYGIANPTAKISFWAKRYDGSDYISTINKTVIISASTNVDYFFVINPNTWAMTCGNLGVAYFANPGFAPISPSVQYSTASSKKTNAASIALYGTFEKIIQDSNVPDITGQLLRLQSELNAYSLPTIEGSFVTDQDGYIVGQQLTLNLSTYGYASKTVTIKQIKKTVISQTSSVKYMYEIQFIGSKKKTFVEFLSGVIDKISKNGMSIASQTLNITYSTASSETSTHQVTIYSTVAEMNQADGNPGDEAYCIDYPDQFWKWSTAQGLWVPR